MHFLNKRYQIFLVEILSICVSLEVAVWQSASCLFSFIIIVSSKVTFAIPKGVDGCLNSCISEG